MRSKQASASPPATNSAVSYFVGRPEPTVIDADVSSKNSAGMHRVASYSLT